MKRFASLIVFFCFITLNACTTAPETYRYIVYLDTAYIEISDGTFEHGSEAILVDGQADRTVFMASFTEATVTVFADGSLSAAYLDGWNATCPAGASVDACSYSAPHPTRGAEVSSLIGFRDVVVRTGNYTPYDEFPIDGQTISPKVWMIFAVGVVFVIFALLILLPHGGRGSLHPSRTLQLGKFVGPRGGGSRNEGGVRNYWIHAAAAAATMNDDFDDRYGKRADTPDTTSVSIFGDRLRAKLLLLLGATLCCGLAIAAILIWF